MKIPQIRIIDFDNGFEYNQFKTLFSIDVEICAGMKPLPAGSVQEAYICICISYHSSSMKFPYLFMEEKNLPVFHSQDRDCWWLGDIVTRA